MNHPDFRVKGKIFATLGVPDAGWGMVKLTPKQQKKFVKAEAQIDGDTVVVRSEKVREPVAVRFGWDRAAEPNLMLQEFIPGGATSIWMFNGYFDASGECRIGFIGQKIRQAPPHTGATTLGVAVRNPTVDELARRFLGQVGYRGIVDLGFRFDARDQRYKLLDVNPRIIDPSRIEGFGIGELKIGSSDFDVHRSSEYTHKDLKPQSQRRCCVRRRHEFPVRVFGQGPAQSDPGSGRLYPAGRADTGRVQPGRGGRDQGPAVIPLK